MLGSITSLGERSRGRRWWVTYTWFLVGALGGGLALSLALLGVREVGQVLPDALAAAIGLAGVSALLARAAVGASPPSPGRQVDHRWLDQFRGWVVGLGFGFQLGAGVFTRIPSFALYLLAACALLGASPVALVISGMGYAAIRGGSAGPGGRIQTFGDLQRITERTGRLEAPIARLTRRADVLAATLLVVTSAITLA
jgi:hypothetical protein